MKKSKLLVIKTGRYETFNPSLWNNTTVSLGDVLRTTIILHSYSDYEIDWLTSIEAKPLLQGISRIDKILTLNEENIDYSKYSLIINLELDFSLKLDFNSHPIVGFIKKENDHFVNNLKNEHINTNLILDFFVANQITTWNQKLEWLLDCNFSDKNYFITPPSSESNIFKIGLNWKVGTKLKDKSLEFKNWEYWFKQLSKIHTVSWQKGESNLIEYINWINSCESIITCDSLGLHIAIALKKNVYAFFKVTSPEEIEMCNVGKSFYLVEKKSQDKRLSKNGSFEILKEDLISFF